MSYLPQLTHRPQIESLSEKDAAYIRKHFDANNAFLTVNRREIELHHIDEVEVAVAARQKSPAGWFVSKILFGGDERFHVGIYFGRAEEVLPNINRTLAEYIVRNIAFYARHNIQYKGPEDILGTVPEN